MGGCVGVFVQRVCSGKSFIFFAAFCLGGMMRMFEKLCNDYTH